MGQLYILGQPCTFLALWLTAGYPQVRVGCGAALDNAWWALQSAVTQVRKAPSWPRSWANFSLLQLYYHRNAWANFHLLGQPSTFLAAQTLYQQNQLVDGVSPEIEAGVALDATVILISNTTLYIS